MVDARQRDAAEAVGRAGQRLGARGDLVERAALGLQRADGLADVVGGRGRAAARLAQRLQGLLRVLHQRRHARQRRVQPGGHGVVQAARELVDAARRVAQLLQCRGKALLVLVAQQGVDALRGLLHLAQDGRALLGQLAERGAVQRQARQAAGARRRRGQRRLRVVQLHMGQARHALVAQRGEGGGADGRVRIHGDTDQHVARDLRVKTDVRDLAYGHALVAHGCLGLQAAHAVLAGQLVELVIGLVAREPHAEAGQQRRHGDHENACGQGMGLVFHQASLDEEAAGGWAMARRPRSPRKKW